jgi:hypothetical protein
MPKKVCGIPRLLYPFVSSLHLTRPLLCAIFLTLPWEKRSTTVSFAGLKERLIHAADRAARSIDDPLLRAAYGVVRPGDIDAALTRLASRSGVPSIDEALVLGALGERVQPNHMGDSTAVANHVRDRAGLAADGNSPDVRLAWAWALQRSGVTPDVTSAQSTLADFELPASLAYPSGLLTTQPPSIPDHESTIRTGTLALLVGLRSESVDMLDLGRLCVGAIAEHVTPNGMLPWGCTLESQWWACVGLTLLSRLTGEPVHILAADSVCTHLERIDGINLPGAAFLRIAGLMAHLPDEGPASLDDEPAWPVHVSLPDVAIAACHDPSVSIAWNWLGVGVPLLRAAPGRCGGYILAGPTNGSWVVASGRMSWDEAIEVDDHQQNGGVTTWTGRFGVEFGETGGFIPVTGRLAPGAVSLEMDVPPELQSALSWTIVFPRDEGSRGESGDLFSWRSANGDNIAVGWDSDGAVRLLWNGGLTIVLGPPMPRLFVLGTPEAVSELTGMDGVVRDTVPEIPTPWALDLNTTGSAE